MSRLTRYHYNGVLVEIGGYYELNNSNYMDVTDKLGKIEDLMEKYDIEDLIDLEIALDYYYHRFDGLHTERVGK